MADGYVLGLDAGTSVVKAAIFDRQGNELSRGARSVPITNPEPHLAEEDMQEVWGAATEAISHALVNGSVPTGRSRTSSTSAAPAPTPGRPPRCCAGDGTTRRSCSGARPTCGARTGSSTT